MTLPVCKEHVNLVKDRVRSTINGGFPNLSQLTIYTHELPEDSTFECSRHFGNAA